MNAPAPTIRALDGGSAADMATARRLFEAYQTFLGVDLCFQGFQDELDGLPGAYASPMGGIWIAEAGPRPDDIVGCIALRPQKGVAGAGELKRLYVLDRARGFGLGRRLCETALRAAADAGYAELRLDTLPQLETAIALYRDMGFADCPPPPGGDVPPSDAAPDGLVYMALRLNRRTV